MDGETTDSTSSMSDGGSSVDMATPVAVPVTRLSTAKRKTNGDTPDPKRTTTYYLRKDEIETLQDQVKSLQDKLQQYERDAAVAKTQSLPTALAANEFLANAVEHTTLQVAGVQSMLSAYNLAMVQRDGVVPLTSFIHLGTDREQRQATLEALFEAKIRAAVRFMAERTRFLDLRVRHRQVEQFERPHSDVTVVSMDVAQFEAGHSLRQVYDALMYLMVHQEIAMSETLGVVMVRESDEVDNFKCCQTRFLSSVASGLEVEMNAVVFATCVDATRDTPGYAVGTIDFVNHDELYPYRPATCVQKEVTMAVTFNEIPSIIAGGKPTIVMARWSHVRMPPPAFPLSREAEADVRNGMLHWCHILADAMQDHLATVPPA